MANSLAYASGYDKNHFRVVALDASSAFCFSRCRMFSERRMGIPARLIVLKSAKSGQPARKPTCPCAPACDFLVAPLKGVSKLRLGEMEVQRAL